MSLGDTHPGARPAFEIDGVDPIDAMFAEGLTDGLPVVPPTEERVAAMLDAGPWAPGDVLLTERTRDTDVTAYQAAVCAVMAGAEPTSWRIIGTTVVAMGAEEFFLHGPTTSTGGAAVMVIVSGPEAARAGVTGAENLFGPGFRANATIGRTVRLIQLLCLSARPGELDKSTQGWPGKLSICFTENLDASPWEPLHESLGHAPDESTVTIFASESGHSVVNHGASDPEPLLLTFADTMGALGSFSNGRSVVVIAPEHARKLADWSRPEIQSFLYEHSARDLATLKRAGKLEHAPEEERDWSGRWSVGADTTLRDGDDQIMVRRGWSPDDILILCGGGAAGGHSSFFPSWSRGRSVGFVTREIPS